MTILLAPATALVLAVSVVSLLCLVALGAVAARIGGAPMLVGAARVAWRDDATPLTGLASL